MKKKKELWIIEFVFFVYILLQIELCRRRWTIDIEFGGVAVFCTNMGTSFWMFQISPITVSIYIGYSHAILTIIRDSIRSKSLFIG